MNIKGISYLSITLAVTNIIVIIGSWIVGAAVPSTHLRSMLSEEGIRWFVGNFAEIMGSQILVWILLASFATGVLRTSGITEVIKKIIHHERIEYRQRLALNILVITISMIICIMAYLTLMPQAVLLGASGKLFPSSFASGIVPIILFTITITAIIYGIVSQTIRSIHQITDAICHGVSSFAPLFLIYILTAQLIYCLAFVLAPSI